MEFVLVFLFVLALELVFMAVQRDRDATADAVAGLLAGSTTSTSPTRRTSPKISA